MYPSRAAPPIEVRATDRFAPAIWLHFEPEGAIGSNTHVSEYIVEVGLVSYPPNMYSLLLYTAYPPGSRVGAAGHTSDEVSVSATGSYTRTVFVVRLLMLDPPTR